MHYVNNLFFIQLRSIEKKTVDNLVVEDTYVSHRYNTHYNTRVLSMTFAVGRNPHNGIFSTRKSYR